jgi:hypothetical protein
MLRLAKWLQQWLAFPAKLEAGNTYRQLESLMAIYSLINHTFALGPLRGWAISPDSLQIVLSEIAQRRPQEVVEFGSGQSTVAIAKLLTGLGGKLISVEHDAEYHARIRGSLELFSLQDAVVSVVQPLVTLSATETTYDLSALPKSRPEVVLVDGPPGGMRNRLAPLRWAYRFLSEGGVIFLDDYGRQEEKECVRLLQAEFPELILNEVQTEKCLAVIKKPGVKIPSTSFGQAALNAPIM